MENELILEIGTEEIPASFIAPALESLENTLADKLRGLSLPFTRIKTGGTPRRLAIAFFGLAEKQPDIREEIMGPPKKAAFDENNQPTKAAIGFAKSKGASLEDFKVVSTPRGDYLSLTVDKKGEETFKLLQELLPSVIASLRFPKSMRWGSGKIPFARPIQWIIALYQDRVIPFEINDVQSGRVSRGHRFMAPDPFEVNNFKQYIQDLKSRYVLCDMQERKDAVIREARISAQEAGGQLLEDQDLAFTVANLVEYPFPVRGSFEKRFLALPKDVLITSMREHQKYFALADDKGRLLPHFVAVNNTHVRDHKTAVEGHQRVLRARLQDALFFFEEDKKKNLANRVEDLEGIVFQTRLGTMREKSRRIASLSEMLATRLAPECIAHCKRASILSKADLLTSMVNEFPSLQGIMGREYALLSGEPKEVADAVYEHYLPLRAGSDLPSSLAGAIIGMADRLDTITGCIGIGEVPTGTADPYGLRRLALGLIHIIMHKNFHLPLREMIKEAVNLHGEKLTRPPLETEDGVVGFIKGRFQNDFIGKGYAAETVEAVLSITFEDINDCRLRIEALAAIQEEPTFKVLAGSFKRVMNIIKDGERGAIDEKILMEPAEKRLYDALQTTDKLVRPLLESRAYREAMTLILTMKEPIDAFFDDVMVMTDDMALRRNRQALLSGIARMFLTIGDFSRMYAIAS